MQRHYLYCLTYPDGKRYIGHTAQPTRRRFEHNKPSRKYGNEKPVMAILCVGSRDYIADLEGKAIIAFHSNDPAVGYNDMIGRSHSEASKRKVSQAHRGLTHTPETRAKMKGRKTWNKGIERTAEEREAIKAGLQASDKTAGARRKLAELNKSRAGKPLSDETRAILSAMRKGVAKSPEQRARMAEARRLWWERRKANIIIAK